MFPYKTNSADYLDYVASVMNREQILADPELCGLLENPYIKENMETALAWRDAKFGDYQDKYNFVEYFLCNGPELDADTILHYRALAQADPVVMEIAYSYFNDETVLSEIREIKYGKSKGDDWADCFTNPCFYLGDFSGVMGSMGDNKNVDTYFNVLGEKLASLLTEKRIQEYNQEQDIRTGKTSADKSLLGSVAEGVGNVVGSMVNAATSALGIAGDTIVEPAENSENPDNSNSSGPAPTSSPYVSKVRPSYDFGWRELGKSIFESDVAFLEQLNEKTKWLKKTKVGDWFSRKSSALLDLIDKANTTRSLGDCYRLWSQVRRLRIFGSDNQYHPITADQLVGDINPDGTLQNPIANPKPIPSDATKGIKKDLVKEATEKAKETLDNELGTGMEDPETGEVSQEDWLVNGPMSSLSPDNIDGEGSWVEYVPSGPNKPTEIRESSSNHIQSDANVSAPDMNTMLIGSVHIN